MRDVKRNFQERCAEIDLYFTFIEKTLKRGAKISLPDGKSEFVKADLAKILKANGFLLLYNLVESCIKKAIEEIYFSMKREGVKYDDIKDSIKREIITYLKNKKNVDEFVSEVNIITEDIIEKSFSADALFSGNVDARKVRDVARKYGFPIKVRNLKVKEEKLLVVKNRRNGLAHGDYSFQECGKEYSVPQMVQIKKEVVTYLEKTLDSIESYINNKEFLK